MERRPEFLSAAAAVLREHAPEPAIEDFDKDFAVGIIRNEGNELNLFNVSTAAGITADAGEIKVCRHVVTSIPCADIIISIRVQLYRRLQAQPIFLKRLISSYSPVIWNSSANQAYSLRLHSCTSWPLPTGTDCTILKSIISCRSTSWVIPPSLTEWPLGSLKES